nr:GNAT family N-acetyltransferase [Microlunatus panaciterrae]
MSFLFDGDPPTAPVPTGVTIVPFSDELSEGVRRAHNEAFADHWGSQPVDRTRWQEQLVRADARPEWSWVALDGETGEVTGYAMNAAYRQDWDAQGYSEGWTDRLGVRRAWRGRGIARALLCASMRSFADAGLEAAGLGVDSDNPTGAFQLYESLGYRAGETIVMHALTENYQPAG